jgi:hypothetical protein
MNWAPNDLVTDADLLAYESKILSSFNVTDWAEKRRRALEDWLAPILAGNGFTLDRLRTRAEPTAVQGYTATAYTDLLSAATSQTADDLNMATIFATAGSDVLYIGSDQPFRGLSVRMQDSVSAVAAGLTVAYWADGWVNLTITDGTSKTAGKAFSGGGAVTWRLPSDWVKRSVNSVGPHYWVKVTISATPTSAKAGQIGVIRRSVLCAPLTFRTLLLIMKEAPTGGPGPWAEKAAWYETEADAALQRAIPLVGGEFDTDVSDQVSAAEAAQTEREVSTLPFRWERG